MRSITMLGSPLGAVIALLLVLTEVTSAVKYLNITATDGSFGHSVIQCWQLSAPFATSTQNGTQGSMVAQLGDLSNATYSIIPAGTNGGAHVAPYPQ